MLCSRCRHQNPDEHRFCGMCGSPLEPPPEPVKQVLRPEPAAREAVPVQAGASRSTDTIFGLDFEPVREELFQREAQREPVRREPVQREPVPPEPRRSEPVQRERSEREPFQREPTIAGPSFLGIGAEPERKSSGYSYLLDYEEPSSHRGLWMVLVLLVVAVLVGLQFRSELRARAMPLYSAVLARVNPQPAPQATPAAPAASAPHSAAPETAAPAPQPATSAGGNEPSQSAGTPSDVGSRSQSAASQPAPSKPDDHAAPAADEKSAAAAKAVPETKEEEAAASKKPEKAAQYARASRSKPAEAAPPEDNRLLVLAQKYIRGEGVRRDCTPGVAYLREAMKRPSAAAATQMGALYATGTCMPLDRVAAYRWFGSALQMTPNNPWLAHERDELYAQMSSAERQRANGQ